MSIAMKKVFESAMSVPFDLSDMLSKIDSHHIMNNLTDDERLDLIELARSKANPTGGLDVMAKLQEMDERIRALEKYHKDAPSDDGVAETAPEYVAGQWYRIGDRVSFNGTVYTCIAPDGTVCVWSPIEYPAYWEASN